MAIVCRPRLDLSLTTGNTGAGAELQYVITGTTNEAEASGALANTAPAIYIGWARQTCRVQAVAPGIWNGTATYSANPSNTNTATFSFDTGGGSVHITQSKQTLATYGTNAPDCKRAIGSTRNGVDGCDITVPVYNFSETHYLTDSQVTNAYKGTLFYLTGKTNAAAFKGCAAGECIFLGASGSRRGGTDWEISYRFAGSPNATINIPGIGDVVKPGWAYLWVRYRQEHQQQGNDEWTVIVPHAAYVERVYDAGDFGSLGIGT